MTKRHHYTRNGSYYIGDSTSILCDGKLYEKLKGNVQLLFTSPPFPLNNKKKYGNLQGDEYRQWFASLAEVFSDLLTDDGSIVIELGNSWVSGRPVQSLLHLHSFIDFVENQNAGLRLCQEFICYNPSRLPSPAPWVTIERIRTIDSFTRLWWMSKSDRPKADNTKVLRPYSKSMKSLLKKQSYNAGKRPSEHHISEESFLSDHGGSIMPNVIEIEQSDEDRDIRLPHNFLSYSNTSSNDLFTKTCKERNITIHPARMPQQLVEFFIRFLTDEGDVVLDPFAGTNTTGVMAQHLNRKWYSFEIYSDYAEQAKIRLDIERGNHGNIR